MKNTAFMFASSHKEPGTAFHSPIIFFDSVFFIWLLFDVILETFSRLVLGKSGEPHEG